VSAAAAAAAASVLAAAFAGPTRVHQVARSQRRKECTSIRVAAGPDTIHAAIRKQQQQQVRSRSMPHAAARVPLHELHYSLTQQQKLFRLCLNFFLVRVLFSFLSTTTIVMMLIMSVTTVPSFTGNGQRVPHERTSCGQLCLWALCAPHSHTRPHVRR
jgi:hypothetical protein